MGVPTFIGTGNTAMKKVDNTSALKKLTFHEQNSKYFIFMWWLSAMEEKPGRRIGRTDGDGVGVHLNVWLEKGSVGREQISRDLMVVKE